MKKILTYFTIIGMIIVLVLAFRLSDTQTDINSLRTQYFGLPTNTVHDFKAQLSNSTGNIFWFVHITDVHIGAYTLTGNNRQYFRDFFENMQFVNPSFVVETGDCVNAKIPLPVEQDVEQWRDRYDILAAAGMINTSYYYDLPGNHDGYGNSLTFSYFLNWSVQRQLEYSWNRTFSFGNYTFIGLNSAQNKGLSWPGGTDGDLNRWELDWLETELIKTYASSNLTMVFAHHWENGIGQNRSTSGKTFLQLLEHYNVSAYFFGHGHDVLYHNQGGTICVETGSLGLTFDEHGYRIVAVDNDGISTIYQPVNVWPAVLITCPIDQDLTIQAFEIPNESKSVPIRALVFDKKPLMAVEYQVDGGIWNAMTLVVGESNLWNASFDASVLSDDLHSITVRASSASGVRTDTIHFRVGTNDQPVIVNGPIPSFERTKNSAPWTLNLTMFEWDRTDLGPDLNWSISNGNSNLCSVVITNYLENLVVFTPIPNAIGTDEITFTLKNSRGQEISQIILVKLADRMELDTFQLSLGLILLAAVVGGSAINFILFKRQRDSDLYTKKKP